ncbi:MAG: ABC transporter permease [Clostridium perfringens]|nr:ABC transporter permease [Clostridium perfringens]
MIEIAKRAFINYTRNRKTMTTFIVFPIILMSLLGILLSSAFSSDETIGNINLYYYNQDISSENENIINILKESSKESSITFKSIKTVEEGKDKVRFDGDSFVIFKGDNIELYTSVEDTLKSTVVSEYLKSIIKTTNAVEESFKINPIKTQEALNNENTKSNVSINIVPKENEISSYAYYAVAELTLFALYIAIVPILAIDYDERKSIKNRLKLAGISDLKYYLGNTLGYFFVSIILTLPGYLFAQFFLGVDWKNPLISYGAIIFLSVVSILLGQVVAIIFNNAQKSANVLKVVIFPIIAFLGGAYMPISDNIMNITNLFDILTKISPLRWINLGLINYMTYGTYNELAISLVINGALMFIFIALLIVISKRREN